MSNEMIFTFTVCLERRVEMCASSKAEALAKLPAMAAQIAEDMKDDKLVCIKRPHVFHMGWSGYFDEPDLYAIAHILQGEVSGTLLLAKLQEEGDEDVASRAARESGADESLSSGFKRTL